MFASANVLRTTDNIDNKSNGSGSNALLVSEHRAVESMDSDRAVKSNDSDRAAEAPRGSDMREIVGATGDYRGAIGDYRGPKENTLTGRDECLGLDHERSDRGSERSLSAGGKPIERSATYPTYGLQSTHSQSLPFANSNVAMHSSGNSRTADQPAQWASKSDVANRSRSSSGGRGVHTGEQINLHTGASRTWVSEGSGRGLEGRRRGLTSEVEGVRRGLEGRRSIGLIRGDAYGMEGGESVKNKAAKSGKKLIERKSLLERLSGDVYSQDVCAIFPILSHPILSFPILSYPIIPSHHML